jgi:hypothetical protein
MSSVAISAASADTETAPLGKTELAPPIWGVIPLAPYVLVFTAFIIYAVCYGFWIGRRPDGRAGYSSGSLMTAGSSSSDSSPFSSSSSSSSSLGSRGGIILAASTGQAEAFSWMRAVISAPVGRRPMLRRAAPLAPPAESRHNAA